jgi:phosphoenolpyruvate phosphomutase
MSNPTLLRQKFASQNLTVTIAAHNPLGARLAERAGFDGIWVSGFELSASYGVPDASLISMTQHLEMVRAISGTVEIPVIADIDTGYGNAINAAHAISQYELAGAAAVVIEDKTFPKETSLLAGARQELVRIEEFEGKIEAALNARRDKEFMIIARTEALIAGLGHDEALLRAERYVKAGADAILIHSKSKTPDEIIEFINGWNMDAPLVLVPTAYPALDEAEIERLGKVKLVIYGNHTVRAIVTALEDVYAQIRQDKGIAKVHEKIVSVEHIFELQGVDNMKKLEKSYVR